MYFNKQNRRNLSLNIFIHVVKPNKHFQRQLKKYEKLDFNNEL